MEDFIITPELRFLEREITILSNDGSEILYTGRYEKVLQQKWVGKKWGEEKWKDVPIIRE